MSTLTYAMVTNKQEEAAPQPGTQAPAVTTYVAAVAALVPAEVLALHAVIISFTTEVKDNKTSITDLATLRWAFWALLFVALFLYLLPRLFRGTPERWDALRAAIPPAAFVVWTMLQPVTAFDAAFPQVSSTQRNVAAVIAAVVLAAIATTLAFKTNAKPPAASPP
jgi:uncharacterized membrane protein